jgi:ribose/xylose/arabinose/galactoside ABC-type transport system permease subunit
MKVPHFLARYALLISLVVLCMVIGFLNPGFLSLDNLTNILLQSAVNLIIALGMTFVIIVGGIDLSVGSLVALTGMALGLLLVHGVAVPVAILGVVLLGALCGGINGIVITRWRVPAFIVTLGTMSAARGVALMLTSGRSVSGFSSGFLWLGNGVVAGIPFPAFVALLLAALCALSLRGTIWGTYLYAIGGNSKAAWIFGLRVPRYVWGVYILSGTFSALAAVFLTSRIAAALPTAGTLYELDAIAAAVIGGASLSGGSGTVYGSVLGALLIGVLRNGLSILNVSSYVQQVLIGGIIIVAVAVEMTRHRSSE